MFRSYDHHQAERNEKTFILFIIFNLFVLLFSVSHRSFKICTQNMLLLLYQLTQLVIKDDHYNVSDIIKQRIRCQLSNPS
jgi:hypothetical protein